MASKSVRYGNIPVIKYAKHPVEATRNITRTRRKWVGFTNRPTAGKMLGWQQKAVESIASVEIIFPTCFKSIKSIFPSG
jgi:hypothetical protein